MKKKTTAQKELEGTARADRSGEIPTTGEIPKPKPGFPKAALPYYNSFAKHLLDNNALQEADKYILYRAAKCAVMLDEAEGEMQNKGVIQKYKTGNRNVSPEFTVFSKLESRFIDYCALLGLNPKARHLMAGSFEKKKEEKPDAIKSLLKPRTDNNTSVA